jgi:formylglycine-generating enzyme required for sulfatase activity
MQQNVFRRLSVLSILLVAALTNASSAQSPKTLTNSIGMKLVLIPKGSFIQGSPSTEVDRSADEKMHAVTITKDVYFGVFEVTQAQYEKVMGNNPSHFQGDILRELLKTKDPRSNESSDFLPVESVNWHDAVAFCAKLSEIAEEKSARREYRLPSEAEWEYACRAGTLSAYHFGDNPELLENFAWYVDNSNGMTHPIGQKSPNPWGLYDMHGNVAEWCADFMDKYPDKHVKDPFGINEASGGVARGGSWFEVHYHCRSANRTSMHRIHDTIDDTGFRVAMTVHGTVEPTAEKTSGQSDTP